MPGETDIPSSIHILKYYASLWTARNLSEWASCTPSSSILLGEIWKSLSLSPKCIGQQNMPITGLRKVARVGFFSMLHDSPGAEQFFTLSFSQQYFQIYQYRKQAVLFQTGRSCSPHSMLLLTNPCYGQAQKIQQFQD